MRRNLIAIATIFAILATFAQLVINKPYAAFDEQPAGWASTNPSKDLSGSLAAFSQLSAQMFLSVNDYSRVTAYASKAYIETRYQDGESKEQSAAAFFAVIKELIPNDTFRSTLPKLEISNPAQKRANAAIALASNDGYDNWPLKPEILSSPLQLGPDKKIYSWAPVAENGPESERTWGLLKSIEPNNCSVPPPPLQNVEQLLSAAAHTHKAREKLDSHPDADEITSLGFEYVGGPNMRTEPSQLMLQILANGAIDAKLSERKTDIMLASAAMAFHAGLIKAWEAKFTYLLASPVALDYDNIPLVVASTPSYPSEQITITQIAMDILEANIPGAKPRLEFSGSLISVPTTRVLPSTQALVSEVSSLLKLLGLIYDFDIQASKNLGHCISQTSTLRGE